MLKLYAYRNLAAFVSIIKVKVLVSNSKNKGDGRQQVITNIKQWRMRDKYWNKMRKKYVRLKVKKIKSINFKLNYNNLIKTLASFIRTIIGIE